MNELLKNALIYGTNGWPVFPLHTPYQDGGCSCGTAPQCPRAGKHPRTARGLLDATRNHTLIKYWWTTWPDANIGIATGPAGLVVLDIDGEEGIKSWRESFWRERLDPEAFTPTVRTGRGWHKYFEAPKNTPIANSAGKIAPGIDVRGAGGYIIAPPSKHADGSTYTWKPETLGPTAPLPANIIALATKRQESRRRPQPGLPASIPVGQRNQTLASLAGTMARAGFNRDAITAALLVENQVSCQEPLGENEVRGIAASIDRYRRTA